MPTFYPACSDFLGSVLCSPDGEKTFGWNEDIVFGALATPKWHRSSFSVLAGKGRQGSGIGGGIGSLFSVGEVSPSVRVLVSAFEQCDVEVQAFLLKFHKF